MPSTAVAKPRRYPSSYAPAERWVRLIGAHFLPQTPSKSRNNRGDQGDLGDLRRFGSCGPPFHNFWGPLLPTLHIFRPINDKQALILVSSVIFCDSLTILSYQCSLTYFQKWKSRELLHLARCFLALTDVNFSPHASTPPYVRMLVEPLER
jgi:hypothetical protein